MKLRFAALALAFALPAFAADRIVLPDDVVPLHYDVAITPDAKAARFAGSETVRIEVKRATSTIVLNAAELTIARAALSGRKDAPAISFDAKTETASFYFAKPVEPGTYTLAIDFAGKINDYAVGLFYLDYDSGAKRALFTQFENSDARRFIPCWDEPARKASFTLAANVPAGQMAVSNMPVEKEEPLPNGLKRVTFAASPKMSSYLLFFGLGDFERVSRKVGNVDVGVVFKRGDAERAQYALETAGEIVTYYNDYFGVDYPLPKLDLIAGPGGSQFFGAMENWGAIFSFERAVLIDPKNSTQGDRIGVYMTNAHEIAHMWFGDLVTMEWWDGIWLNEGFASWMDTKQSAELHPEWNLWLEALRSKEAAMTQDAREGTHPVIQPIVDVLQANEAFDAITYEKGMSVIRMLEATAGKDAWREAVRAYMKKHAYGNTVTDDLWAELDKTSPVPVSAIAHDFTLQAGVPLIRVAATKKGIRLTQDQFWSMRPGTGPLSWHVPVVAQKLDSKSAWLGVVSREAPAEIASPKGATMIVNAGQAGYFRTLYDRKLAARLAARFASLSADDQLGLLNDAAALGYAGYEPMGDYLRLAGKVRPGMNPIVLGAVAHDLRALDRRYRDMPGQPAFRAFALKILRPLFASVGWTPRPGEPAGITLLRHDLLAALNQLDAPEIIAEARKRFAAYVADEKSLTGELRASVLPIVARHASPVEWEQLHTFAKNAKSTMDQRQIYGLLGTAQNDALARRALELTLTDELPVTMRPALISAVAGNPRDGGGTHTEMALDFTLAHGEALGAQIEPAGRHDFVPALAAQSDDPATIAKLRHYAEAKIPATARQAVVKAEAAIRNADMIRTKRLPDVDRWLKKNKRRHVGI